MELNKIHNIDFLKNDLPDKCANLIIADPPYFEVKGEFDFVWSSFDEYLKDVERWANECKRLLKDNWTLFWYGHAKKIAYSQIILDKYFNLENSLVWKKKECQTLRSDFEQSRIFAPITERILMYSLEEKNNNKDNFFDGYYHILDYMVEQCKKAGIKKGNQYEKILGSTNKSQHHLSKSHFHLISEIDYNKLKTYCEINNLDAFKKEYEQLRQEYEQLRRPFNNLNKYTDVLEFSQESHITSNYDHQTQKPETLTRALILTCSRESDLVLVPFAGSGTECAMGKKEKRNFIGFDINQKYVEISNKRCSEIINSLF